MTARDRNRLTYTCYIVWEKHQSISSEMYGVHDYYLPNFYTTLDEAIDALTGLLEIPARQGSFITQGITVHTIEPRRGRRG